MAEANGVIHMLYRFCEKGSEWYGKAIDWGNLNGVFPYVKDYICYARLNSDGTLLYDSDECVLAPEPPYETIACEDPRIVPFEGAYYIFYCALGVDNLKALKARVGVAVTGDFKSYKKLGVIDSFAWDKDAFIFPERINGKIAYVHRISPNIQIDYFDSFDEMLSAKSWDDYENRVGEHVVLRGVYDFEALKIGGGAPPIRTDKGWLMIYHGVDRNHVYHIGAALLDINNPSKVVARLPYPVLSPEEAYETCGDYIGCVFPQGFYIKDKELFISYGTADRYTAIAKVGLKSLVDELVKYPA
jgi:predicted GH43/DUF377 family glycosyl hydrolase